MLNIKGFEEYTISKNGTVTNTRTGRILKEDITSYGYCRVTLSARGNLKRVFVHRLVAEHFLSRKGSDGRLINHINGIKTDNKVENLEWCTCKENTIHAFDTGLRASGEDGANAKLSNKDVHSLCEEIARGLARGEILSQERFGHVTKTQFDDIRRRKSWKRISCNFMWRTSNDYPKGVEASASKRTAHESVMI